LARIRRGEIRWADLAKSAATTGEEFAKVIEGLGEIIGEP